MRRYLFIVALCASAFAQNGIVPVPPVFLGPAFSPRLGASLTISFCTSTATLLQCTGGSAYAQAYSDSTNSFPINQATNPLKTDALGNPPAFYGAPGQYSYAVSGPGIAAPQGPYQIFVSCIPGTTCVATGANNAFTGNNTHSGTETFTNGISSNSAAISGALTVSGGATLPNPCAINGLIYVSGSGCYTSIAAAITAASSSQSIYVPSGTWTQAFGTLTFSNSFHLICQNPATTLIVFTGASGNGILVNYQNGNGLTDDGSSIEGCQFIGPGGSSGVSGDAGTGIQIGDGSHVSQGLTIRDSQFHGFAIGATYGNPASWAIDFLNDMFSGNTQDFVYNFSTGIATAISRFSHTRFQGSQQANAIQLAGTLGGHFIFEDCFITDDPFTVSNGGWLLSLENNDWENTTNSTNIYLTISGGIVHLSGMNLFQQTKSSGSVPSAFITASAGTVKIDAVYLQSSATMSGAVNISGTANLDLAVIRDFGTFTSELTGSTTGAIRRQTEGSGFYGNTFPGVVDFTEGGGASGGGLSGADRLVGDSTAHCVKTSYNNGTFYCVPQTILSGTAVMTTGAIAAVSGATITCGSTVTVSASGVATTDTITFAPSAAPTSPNTGLIIQAWPTANNVNFAYCNPTASSLTPGAETLNWRVVR